MKIVDADPVIDAGEAARLAEEPSTTGEREPIVVSGTIAVPADPPANGFFDPDDVGQPPAIELCRVTTIRTPPTGGSWIARFFRRIGDELGDAEREAFKLRFPIGYHDTKTDRVIVVPGNLDTFTTDLTSVPKFFTWLIPRTGPHLPAAILHDGLVHRKDEAPTYVSDAVIERGEADRILRDAMGRLGISLVRRWLIWATVLIATLAESTDRTRWRITLAVTGLAIAVLGSAATIDLVDLGSPLPWMGERSTPFELATGSVAAIVISAVLSVAWGRRWLAGMIFCSALALLVHVTIAIALVYSTFSVVESVMERRLWRALIYAAFIVLVLLGLVLVVTAFADDGFEVVRSVVGL